MSDAVYTPSYSTEAFMPLWIEAVPKKEWTRTDGAMVKCVGLYLFAAWGPDGVQLLFKSRKPRTWNSPDGAQRAVNSLYPAESQEGPGSDPQISPAADGADLVLEAAQAVRDAVGGYEGRVRSVDSWKGVAAQVLGVSRLHRARWEGVLKRGVSHGLFEVDDKSYSYPVIIVLEPAVPESPEVLEELVVQSPMQPRTVVPSLVARTPADDWDPPSFMDCGHFDWHRGADGSCRACAKKIGPNWTRLSGEYMRPLPLAARRTKERWGHAGFGGYCCDGDGMYIGGLTNNCRLTGDERCEIHAAAETA